jgi:hypothetical protein
VTARPFFNGLLRKSSAVAVPCTSVFISGSKIVVVPVATDEHG